MVAAGAAIRGGVDLSPAPPWAIPAVMSASNASCADTLLTGQSVGILSAPSVRQQCSSLMDHSAAALAVRAVLTKPAFRRQRALDELRTFETARVSKLTATLIGT